MIRAALGDATSVVNIGAGSGSYEPTDLAVVPVEPSELMIRQRPPSLPTAVRGVAEALPLPDKSVDAALAVLAAHHWTDRPAAFAEIRRVARRRAVFFTHDPDRPFGWLDDFFPGLAGYTTSRYPRLVEFEVLGASHLTRHVPADCTTAYAASWRRPTTISTNPSGEHVNLRPADRRLVADVSLGRARSHRRYWHSATLNADHPRTSCRLTASSSRTRMKGPDPSPPCGHEMGLQFTISRARRLASSAARQAAAAAVAREEAANSIRKRKRVGQAGSSRGGAGRTGSRRNRFTLSPPPKPVSDRSAHHAMARQTIEAVTAVRGALALALRSRSRPARLLASHGCPYGIPERQPQPVGTRSR